MGYIYQFGDAEKNASNIACTEDFVYYATGRSLKCYYKGWLFYSSDVADGMANILAISGYNYRALEVENDDGTKTIQIVTPTRIVTVSEKATDAYVAYDTLYWMDTNYNVYECQWMAMEEEPECKLFFENAISVSHHADEAEGAIVEAGSANWDGYGYDNIYSPYGI